jgi:hypothetical protein
MTSRASSARWESWAADVAESHTTYPVLVRFRSPEPLSSWVTALLAVLDSAALFLALSPQAAPVVPARLCLRGGFRCFNRIARTMGFDIPEEPGPDAGTSLTYAEFLDALSRMRQVGFPVERDPAEAWPDFVGWRVNYEQAAYAVAAAVYAVPALWSGPRRRQVSPIAPIRPRPGRPGNKDAPGGTRVSGHVRGAVQQESCYPVSAHYLSNRSALAPDPADADIDDLRPWVEDQATDSRQQFARAQRPSPAAGNPLEHQEPQPVQSHRSPPLLALKAVQPLRIRKTR